jgi:alkylhydroperoxidase family enzyme
VVPLRCGEVASPLVTISPVPTSSGSWREVAPDAWATFLAIERCAECSLDAAISIPMRSAIAAILGVPFDAGDTSPAADPRAPACIEFTEQFVVDVAGITDSQRQAMFAAMGADAFTFVQTLFVADVFTRARIAVGKLFHEPFAEAAEDTSVDGAQLWPLLEQFMRQVAMMRALDPLTTELVRLRGARVHNCRLCQSRRSVKALDAAGDARVFDELDPGQASGISARDRVALQLTDALVTQPAMIDAALVASVHEHFTVAEITEIVLDVVRNAANKIAVAFGADAPIVTEGVEFYDIDPTGEVVADVDVDIVRAATG